MHSIHACAVTVALGKALRPSLLASAEQCWRIDRDEVSSVSVRLRRSLMGAPQESAWHMDQCLLLFSTALIFSFDTHVGLSEMQEYDCTNATRLQAEMYCRFTQATLSECPAPTLAWLLRNGHRPAGACTSHHRASFLTAQALGAGLFARGDAQSRKLRRLIVDLQAPTMGNEERTDLAVAQLNTEQRSAVSR